MRRWLSLAILFLLYMAAHAQSDMQLHVVQRGDTLYYIAQRYGISMDDIIEANGLADPSDLDIGQRLFIPVAVDTVITSADNIAPTVSTQLSTLEYTVEAGDTLSNIALRFNTDMNRIAEANQINDPTRIYAGQVIVIPDFELTPLFTGLPALLTDATISPTLLVEGQTGRITLISVQPVQIEAAFMGKSIPVISQPDNLTHYIYIGIPVFTEPQVYPLELSFLNPADNMLLDTVSANVQVLAGGYGNEIINLMEGRDTLLNENVETAEEQLLIQATQRINPERYFDGQMSLPAAAAMTSGYGTRRSYDGGIAYNRYHSGADFAGVPGTPILAPADGIIVLADTLNVRGNATMIDHGWGIYTGYWHQTDIYVQVGDYVEAGQIIGTIGATGRVTGAHLHWELWVNQIAVDPMQWVQKAF